MQETNVEGCHVTQYLNDLLLEIVISPEPGIRKILRSFENLSVDPHLVSGGFRGEHVFYFGASYQISKKILENLSSYIERDLNNKFFRELRV